MTVANGKYPNPLTCINELSLIRMLSKATSRDVALLMSIQTEMLW